MNTKLPFRFTLASIIALVLLAGCKKNSNDPPPLPSCKVQRIIIPSNMLVASNSVRRMPYIAQNIPHKTSYAPNIIPGAADTLTFTYNKSGNPVSVIHQMDIGDNMLFKYDKWDRLSEFIDIYPSGTAGDYWHKYSYDGVNSDRIIADSAFRDFTSQNGKLISYNDIDLTIFAYDAYGRIIQSTEYVLGNTIVTQYNYDSQGNLQKSGSVYDDKINIHLTNKIWMFLDRDYSVNNPVDNGNYTYNSVGLPISIMTNSSSVTAGFQFIVVGYPFYISNDLIDYSCP